LYWKNPQFQIHLIDPDLTDNKNKCTMIVSLMEKERNRRKDIAIGYDIYEVRLTFKKCLCIGHPCSFTP